MHVNETQIENNKRTQNPKLVLGWFRFFIIVVLVIGVWFRFINIDQKVYWFDEAATTDRILGLTDYLNGSAGRVRASQSGLTKGIRRIKCIANETTTEHLSHIIIIHSSAFHFLSQTTFISLFAVKGIESDAS